MSAEHTEVATGVLTLTFAVPPKYGDDRLQRVVQQHNEFVKMSVKFLEPTSDSLVPHMANLESQCKMYFIGTTAVLFTSRRRACQAADEVTVGLFARHHDHFGLLLGNDIEQFVQQLLKPHMVPVPGTAVDAVNLGYAIGPDGDTIAAVGKGALLIWSPQRPVDGTYTIYLPKTVARDDDAIQRAHALCEFISQQYQKSR